MTAQLDAPEVLEISSHPAPEPSLSGTGVLPERSRRPLSPVPTYAGILTIAVGLLLIGIAWNQVAAEANVARQVPYVVSGGLFGLALVIIGALVVNVASKRRETALREEQTALLADSIAQLGRVLGDDDPFRP